MKTQFKDKRKRNATPEEVEKYAQLTQKVHGYVLENGPLRNISRDFQEPKRPTNELVVHPHRFCAVKYQYHFDRIENGMAVYRMNC